METIITLLIGFIILFTITIVAIGLQNFQNKNEDLVEKIGKGINFILIGALILLNGTLIAWFLGWVGTKIFSNIGG